MSSANLNLRDPVLYRIMHAITIGQATPGASSDVRMGAWSERFHRRNYAFDLHAEFENHRPLYDWFCQTLRIYHPRQLEFAR